MNTTKKIIASLVCAALAFVARAAVDEDARAAFVDAAKEAEAGLRAAPIPTGSAVALLPVAGAFGEDWMAGLLQNAVTAAGKTCVVAKHDPAFAAILAEMEWDARKADILDPKTIDRFGALKSAQVLLSANVTVAQKTAKDDDVRCVFVEVELHAVEISTKKHLWGGVFAKRRYLPGCDAEPVDVSEIPLKLREAMQNELRARIAKSITASGKLGAVKTVAILPISADTRAYIGDLTRDAVSRTRLTPKNLDILTLAEARHAMRDSEASDAIMYGSLRDLSVSRNDEDPVSEVRSYNCEVQLCIENAKTREQLWSETFLVSEKEVKDGWWYALTRYFPSLKSRPWLLVLVPLLGLVFLIVLCKVLRAMTRVR